MSKSFCLKGELRRLGKPLGVIGKPVCTRTVPFNRTRAQAKKIALLFKDESTDTNRELSNHKSKDKSSEGEHVRKICLTNARKRKTFRGSSFQEMQARRKNENGQRNLGWGENQTRISGRQENRKTRQGRITLHKDRKKSKATLRGSILGRRKRKKLVNGCTGQSVVSKWVKKRKAYYLRTGVMTNGKNRRHKTIPRVGEGKGHSDARLKTDFGYIKLDSDRSWVG